MPAGGDEAQQIRRRVRIVNLEAPRASLEQGQSVLLVAAPRLFAPLLKRLRGSDKSAAVPPGSQGP